MQQLEYFPEREKPRPRKAARRFPGFRLQPGINPPISDDRWNAVKDDPVMVLLLEADAVKVTAVADPVDTSTTTKASSKKTDTPPAS